eukprot:SAG11_NODE_12396_length_705_cov_3.331683_1_plen_89_part_00
MQPGNAGSLGAEGKGHRQRYQDALGRIQAKASETHEEQVSALYNQLEQQQRALWLRVHVDPTADPDNRVQLYIGLLVDLLHITHVKRV